MVNYVLGVDVGGTKILIGLMDGQHNLIEPRSFPTGTANQQAVIASISDAIEIYIANLAQKPAAIGLGLAGYVNAAAGIWEDAMNLRIEDPVPICDMFSKLFDIPVFADNDVRTATMAEIQMGAGQRTKDFIYINIGTGIAAGMVCGGHLIRGVSNYAGELGHMVSGTWERGCKCGRKGCLEPMASGGGIIQAAKEGLKHYPNSSLKGFNIHAGIVYKEAEKGDELARMIAEDAIRALEESVVNLVNLLNPSLIVFGGGALEQGLIFSRVKRYVYENSLPAAAQALEDICLSVLNPAEVGVMGACILAKHKLEEGVTQHA